MERATPDAADVLAFIAGYSDMPSNDWRERWPEWSGKVAAALERFAVETDYGRRGWARSSASVDSQSRAVHYWVFLPLIRESLGQDPRP